LPAGKYTFKVKAKNNEGVWSEQPAEFRFVIKPPFWATWWFRILLILTIVGGALAWHKNHVRNIKIQKEKLEVQVAKRTKELGELNAMKDKFFSIIAHDLKGALQVQLSGSRLLSDRIQDIDKKTIKILGQELKKNTNNLFKLLENLLEWARIQTGRITHQPEALALQTIVDSCIDILSVNAKDKGIHISAQVPEEIVVRADKNMIQSVIHNLASNAIKFTRKDGEVKITAVKPNGFVEVAVSDTGVGIDEDRQKKLFRIDEHVTTAGTAEEKGSGLGLILCKEFVEKNGGKIWIESKKGKGTTVRLTLPAG
jgi:signal transduction histidine kinase